MLRKELLKQINRVSVTDLVGWEFAELHQDKTPLGLRDYTLLSQNDTESTSHQNTLHMLSRLGSSMGGAFDIISAGNAMKPSRNDPSLPCFSLDKCERMNQALSRPSLLDNIDEHLLRQPRNPGASIAGLQQQYLEREENLLSFAICGLAGMGKTMLAVEYAYSRRSQFEAIFWLNGSKLASSFAQIARKLGLEDEYSDLAASRDVAMGWLAQPLRKTAEPDTPENNVNWLIIFDNVNNFDDLAEFWPSWGYGSVLVTSRLQPDEGNRYVKKSMNLPLLTISESETLMESLTHVKDDDDKALIPEIVRRTGGLPLAITQISAVVLRRSIKLSDTKLWDPFNDERIEKSFKKQIDPLTLSITNAWAINFDRLSSMATALLKVMCVLDPDNIQEELLIYKSGIVELDHYPMSRPDYCQATTELLSTLIMQRNAGSVSMHRLIQAAGKAMMSKAEHVAAFQTATSLVTVAWRFQSLEEHYSIARFPQCEAVYPSVLRLRIGYESLRNEDSDFPFDIRTARLFNDTGWYP